MTTTPRSLRAVPERAEVAAALGQPIHVTAPMVVAAELRSLADRFETHPLLDYGARCEVPAMLRARADELDPSA